MLNYLLKKQWIYFNVSLNTTIKDEWSYNMLAIYYLLLLLSLLLVTKIKYRTIVKLNSLFNISWCISCGLASLGVYGLNKPIFTVHILSTICILIFNIIYMSASIKQSSIIKIVRTRHTPRKPNYRIIVFVNIIAYIFSAPFIWKSIAIIRSVGLYGLRSLSFIGTNNFANTNQLTIFQNIIEPIFIATILILAIDIGYKRQKKSMFIITIIDVIIYTILFGGRAMILQSILFIIISILLTNNFTSIKDFILQLIRKYKIIIIFTGFSLAAIMYITSQRSFYGKSFIENALLYFVGPFAFLSELLKDNTLTKNLMFGKATFGWVLGLFSIIIKLLFGTEYNGADYIITQVTSRVRVIGNGITFNALPTMLYAFLKDFGYLGSVIGPALYALTMSIVEKKYYKLNSLFWLALLIFFIYGIPFTVMNYYYMTANTVILVIIIFSFTVSVK
ncbi:MAG: O-antigen polymerase [Gudongella sp.]|nr:O-antigen polymerase [Gudongella sp.]